MSLSNFKVKPSLQDAIELRWDEYSADEFNPYYGILRSHGPNSDFSPVDVIQANQYVDRGVNLLKKWREYYYKILVLDDDGSGDKFFPDYSREDESEVKRIQNEPDAVTLEIIRRNNLLLKNYLSPNSNQKGPGQECYVLKRMSRGERCGNCWDADAKRRTTKDCEECGGTGFEKGYFDPIPAYIQFNPENKRQQITDQGVIEQSQTTARMSNFPIVNPRDIIVEPYFDRRYRVVQSAKTEKGRYLISQNLSLREINPDQIEYDIDVVNDEITTDSSELLLNAPSYLANPSPLIGASYFGLKIPEPFVENVVTLYNPNSWDSMIHYYPLNGNPNDDAGSTDLSVSAGSPTYSAAVDEEGVVMDGDDALDAQFNETPQSQTVCAWINFNSVSANQFIFGVSDTTIRSGIFLNNDESSLQYFCHDGTPQKAGTSSLPSTGTKIFAAGVYDLNNDEQHLYIDGSLVDTNQGIGSLPYNDPEIAIGELEGSAFADVNYIDECLHFDKALSASEIDELYQKGV